MQTKDKELQHLSERKDDLQTEVSSVRKDLKATYENVTTLEAEVIKYNYL